MRLCSLLIRIPGPPFLVASLSKIVFISPAPPAMRMPGTCSLGSAFMTTVLPAITLRLAPFVIVIPDDGTTGTIAFEPFPWTTLFEMTLPVACSPSISTPLTAAPVISNPDTTIWSPVATLLSRRRAR